MAKRPERVFSRLPPSSAEVKDEWSDISTPPVCLRGINKKMSGLFTFGMQLNMTRGTSGLEE
jgi:hypothetical protein